ncbi:MAG: hypothetical protein A2Y73_06255 [Chloroflexi bacterium RBG_13_56_8]|nr:MAG: hypothetical protein A2Y73_06255 [Chloroflexi bacterium RBG_13_56_8]
MNPIDVLCRLQKADHEWDEKAQLYQNLRQRLADQSDLDLARNRQRECAESLAKTKSRLRDNELKLESLQSKVKDVEKDLYSGRIHAPKDLENLRKDSLYLRQQASELEDQVLLGLTEADELETATRQAEEELRNYERKWAEEQQELQGQYTELRTQLHALQKARSQLRGDLGQSELRLYDALRAQKGGLAISPMKENICQTCRVRVPTYKARIVEAGEGVITCEGCGRILCRE